MAKVWIGTSGYSYPHWRRGLFYPQPLGRGEELSYYSHCFSTVELNNSFYRLPQVKTFISWRQKVPQGFVFAVKVSRFLTHFKKMKEGASSWELFLSRAAHLQSKLGPFLFQFPASFPKNKKRLEDFLEMLSTYSPAEGLVFEKLRFAFEFRHPSWFSEDVYQVFKNHPQACLVMADSGQWPKLEKATGSFSYIRLHGPSSLYSSGYSPAQLKPLAQKIEKHLQEGRDVFVYFNNDGKGRAVKNAQELKKLLKREE